MGDYMDLVLVRHDNDSRKFLFRAPRWRYLDKGDRVLVDTQRGEQEATVVSSMTVDVGDDSDALDMVLNACGVTLDKLRKVIGKIEIKKFDYPDEVEEIEEIEEDE